jgi:two-component system, cell cycle response regulator
VKALIAGSEEFTRGCVPPLVAQGWQVVTAHDAATALMAATRDRPDVLVAAARLPGGGGHSLVARFRGLGLTAEIPVIGVADEAGDADALEDAGAWRCLPSTVEPTALAAALASETGGHGLPRTTSEEETFDGGLLAPEDGCGRVLIVEDDEPVRAMLVQALQLEGHEVVSFHSADAALEAGMPVLPDLVLLDVMLPGMSGMELLAHLRDQPGLRDVPVLLVSALDGRAIVDGLRSGAQDFIRKPFDIEELLARVAGALAAKRARDGLDARVGDLERLALTDKLTGVDNRRSAERHLTRLTAQAERTGRSLALLLIDIDRFKDVNDIHGHVAGDQVLTAVAQELTRSSRAADIVARWGGEEFVVLLPETGLEGAMVVAERLRAAIAGMGRPVAASTTGVTVSVGVAAGTSDPRKMLVDADAALYRAKRAGRNQIAAASAKAATRALAGLLTASEEADPGETRRLG